jgi:hypothetical protein
MSQIGLARPLDPRVCCVRKPTPPGGCGTSATGALTARHVGVAPSIVNNNPKTLAGSCARLLQPQIGSLSHVASFGQNGFWARLADISAALRCVSKHEGTRAGRVRVCRTPSARALARGRLACLRVSDRKSVHGLRRPRQIEWHSCEQLSPQRKYWETREQELKLLMDKATQSTRGAAIIVVAYQGDYVAARESRSSTQRHARKNAKCRTSGKIIPSFDDARRSLHLT